jgi:nickel/cobalt transporter (NicO) family protein
MLCELPERAAQKRKPVLWHSMRQDKGRECGFDAIKTQIALGAGFSAVWCLPALAQSRTPFGMPGEGAASAPSNALVAWLLQQQSIFYKQLQSLVNEAAEGRGFFLLLGVALLYGVLHAAGPGHGKAVISSYIIANERALKKAIAVAFGAAAVQALIAILAVLLIILVIGLAGQARARAFGWIELSGYLFIAFLGFLLLLRKSRSLLHLIRGRTAREPIRAPHADCDHVHLPDPAMIAVADHKGMIGAMVAAGIRPCTGSIILFTFCIAKGLYGTGVLSVVMIALGTALITSLFAVLAVFGKSLALRLASGRGSDGEVAMRLVEMAGAFVIMTLGFMLAVGFWWSGPAAGL